MDIIKFVHEQIKIENVAKEKAAKVKVLEDKLGKGELTDEQVASEQAALDTQYAGDTGKSKLPVFKAGDNVVVNYKIIEGDKVRVQAFRGDVIQIKGQGEFRTFTVRKISNSVGVERIFPFISPNIDTIEVMKRGRVRRARLFYLRGLVGKKARIKEMKG